ncbi:MAG: ABC transporter permease subunit [Clostridiaceae bacterium]
MKDMLLRCFSYASGLIVGVVVLFIFLYILFKGYSVINGQFLLNYPQGMPLGMAGGIFPAIMGSLYLGAVAALIAGIFSLATAIYLSFFCRNKAIYEINRFVIQCISGIPSIVLGLFGYSFLIMDAAIPKSLLSAGITLAVMIIPFITLRIEKVFNEFSREIIASSLALGVSLTHTVIFIVLPVCRREIATAIALASAYAMGATAPIMFTGAVLYTGRLPSLLDPFMALPYHLYILVNEGYSLEMAYGTAFVLLVLLIIINLACQCLDGRKG